MVLLIGRRIGGLDHSQDILRANSKGGWIIYDFSKFDKFDFNLSTKDLIKYLNFDIQTEEFTNVVYQNFIEYFQRNEKTYWEYLKSNVKLRI